MTDLQRMDTTLYKLLVNQLPEHPDLSIVQEKFPVPEDWPVLLEGVQMFRKQIESFTVSDGTHRVVCRSVMADLYDKVGRMEPGTIIHLMGAEVVFDDSRKQYILDIHGVYTLKEYDNHLKQRQMEEARRLAKLREEGFFEEFNHVVSSVPEFPE